MGSKIMAIAALHENSKHVIGYRLMVYDLDKGLESKCKDVPTNNIVYALLNKTMHIENMEVAGGQLEGTQGSLDRLPKVSRLDNLLIGEDSVIILNKIGDIGYTCTNYTGRIIRIETEKLIKFIKINGIANGKLALRDGTSYISAISGNYEEVEYTKSNPSRSNVKIEAPKTQLSSKRGIGTVVNAYSENISDNIEANDVFSVLTEEQRKCIENYYVWWTITTFESLAGSKKLQLDPKKTAELAEIRGDLTWVYAGSKLAKMYSPVGYDYCSLGHKLYYVHYAKGVADDGTTQYIKFGSTCVADFFKISVEGVRKLNKVTSKMQSEIQLLVDKLADHNQKPDSRILDKMWEDTGFLGNLISEGNLEKSTITDIFGQFLGNFLLLFKKYDLPYPESLINLCIECIHKEYGKGLTGALKFYKQIMPQFTELYDYINNSRSKFDSYTDVGLYLSHLYDERLEGVYSYDPIEGIGARGPGKFTSTARNIRKARNHSLSTKLDISKFNYIELRNVSMLINEYYKLSQKLKIRLANYTKEQLDELNLKLGIDITEDNPEYSIMYDRWKYMMNNAYRRVVTDSISNYTSTILVRDYGSNYGRAVSDEKINEYKQKLENTDESQIKIAMDLAILLKCFKYGALGEMDYNGRFDGISDTKLDNPLSNIKLSLNDSMKYFLKYADDSRIFNLHILKVMNGELRYNMPAYMDKYVNPYIDKINSSKSVITDNNTANNANQSGAESFIETLINDSNKGNNENLNSIIAYLESNGKFIDKCKTSRCLYNKDGKCLARAIGREENSKYASGINYTINREISINQSGEVQSCILSPNTMSKIDSYLKNNYTRMIKSIEDKELDNLQILRKLYDREYGDFDSIRLALMGDDNNNQSEIARSIATLKKNVDTLKQDSNLSSKQLYIVKNEIEKINKHLKDNDLEFDPIAGVYKIIPENTVVTAKMIKDVLYKPKENNVERKIGDTSDGENKTYSLSEFPEIERKIREILNSDDVNKLDMKKVSIMSSIRTRGKLTDRQYNNIKDLL